MVARTELRRRHWPAGGWALPAVAAVAGLAAGAGLAWLFNVVHSNWTSIPGVTAQATSTVPYWLVQFLGPILVSACWTALVLLARSVPRWKVLTALALGAQLVVLAVSLVPMAIGGNGGVSISNFSMPLQLLLAPACPIAAFIWPRGHGPTAVGWHVAAAAAFPVTLWLAQSLWAPQTVLF